MLIRRKQKHFGTAGRAHGSGQSRACAMREPSGNCDALICGTNDNPPQAKSLRRGRKGMRLIGGLRACAMRALSGYCDAFICGTNDNPPQAKHFGAARGLCTDPSGRLRARCANFPAVATLSAAGRSIVRRKQKHFGAEGGHEIGRARCVHFPAAAKLLSAGRMVIRRKKNRSGTAGRAAQVRPVACVRGT